MVFEKPRPAPKKETRFQLADWQRQSARKEKSPADGPNPADAEKSSYDRELLAVVSPRRHMAKEDAAAADPKAHVAFTDRSLKLLDQEKVTPYSFVGEEVLAIAGEDSRTRRVRFGDPAPNH